MSKEMQEPSEAPQGAKSGRRRVIKRLLIGLGASAIIQPSGGVFGLALGQDKKDDDDDGGKKKKKGGKKKDGDEPKKD